MKRCLASMYIFNDSSQKYSLAYDRSLVVEKQGPERLADFVRRVRTEKGFSLSRVQRNSGDEIDGSYVNRIENDLVTNVTTDKLRALAKGLEVSEDQIFAVARGKTLEPMSPQDFHSALEALGVEQFQAYGGMANLTADDRQEIIAMIEAMIEQKLKRKQAAQKSRGAGRK